MHLSKELLFFFSALGAFNGLVLSMYFFFFTKKKYLANYFLGALLLALSIRVGKSVFVYFDKGLLKIYLQIGLTACFFIGPFLYYFLKSAIGEINVMRRSWKWSLAVQLLVILGFGLWHPYEQEPMLWKNYVIQLIYTQWSVYIIASGFVLKGILKNLFLKDYKMKASETWLLTIYAGNFIIFIFYFMALTMRWTTFPFYISGSICFSMILYLIISILMYRKNTDDLFLLPALKYSVKKLSDEDADVMIKRLEKVMVDQEFYKNPNLKLGDLSQEINVSSHQLSQLLNDNHGKNFTTFINEFRIKEACRMISSGHRFTLESIGYEVGFNSKSTFFAAFKKLTGTTPSNYQQSLKSQLT